MRHTDYDNHNILASQAAEREKAANVLGRQKRRHQQPRKQQETLYKQESILHDLCTALTFLGFILVILFLLSDYAN